MHARWPSSLQVLGGKHMVPESAVTVLGQPPFHATALTSSGALSYVGGNWERDIAFAGYAIPLAVRARAHGRTAGVACCIGKGGSAARLGASPDNWAELQPSAQMLRSTLGAPLHR